jgi:osmoprotectant transport system substrate-binding protein
VVASFNFPESELLAEMYAQALAAAGVPVRVQLDLGTRELVLPAFQEGFVDVAPEYVGSALQAVDPGAVTDASPPSVVAARLSAALAPWRGQVLGPSSAGDQNGFAVSRVIADQYGLRAVSDLRKLSAGLTLTGPPECPSRAYCLIGLERTYGLHIRQFVALDTEAQRVTALHEGVANVALMFSTDAELASGDLVFLADDRHLQPADNVAPVVRDAAVARFGERLVRTLDNVSARLSTRELIFLNWRMAVAGRSAEAEAHGWLVRQGLVPRRD